MVCRVWGRRKPKRHVVWQILSILILLRAFIILFNSHSPARYMTQFWCTMSTSTCWSAVWYSTSDIDYAVSMPTGTTTPTTTLPHHWYRLPLRRPRSRSHLRSSSTPACPASFTTLAAVVGDFPRLFWYIGSFAFHIGVTSADCLSRHWRYILICRSSLYYCLIFNCVYVIDTLSVNIPVDAICMSVWLLYAYDPHWVLSTTCNVVEPDRGTVEAEDGVCPEVAQDLVAADIIPLGVARDTPGVPPIRVMFLVPLTNSRI